MSEYQEQKRTRPAIDVLAARLLDEPLQREVLAFVQFLRENRLSAQWASTNSYKVSDHSRGVCLIKLAEQSYQLWLNTQYDEAFNACFSQADESIKQYLMKNMVYCSGCGTCKPGLNVEVLGAAQRAACVHPVIRMANPDPALQELAKQLVLLRKQAIREGKVPKVSYVAMKKREKAL